MANSASKKEFPSAFELFKPSWEAVKSNLITFIELILIPIVIGLIISLPSWRNATSASSTINGALFLRDGFAGLISLLFAPALAYTQLQSVRGKTVDFLQALKASTKFFWRFIGLVIVMGIVILVGFVLFIVPGLFMLRRYILAPYYLIDKDMKIFEAMRASAADSKKFSSAIWGLIGVEILCTVVGVIPIIGWIISAALSIAYYCAPAIRYTQVKKRVTT
jgi:hypothetical protein